jgi:hypothetical protein
VCPIQLASLRLIVWRNVPFLLYSA